MKSKKVIYISGPVSGIKDFNYPLFNRADAWLRSLGFNTISPSKYPAGLTQSQYMDISLAGVRSADALYVLPNYQKSKGAACEIAYAICLSLVVCYSSVELLAYLNNNVGEELKRNWIGIEKEEKYCEI